MTRYLLVGNGITPELEKAAVAADIIIQINVCRHFNRLPHGKTRWVFVTNTGGVFQETVETLRCRAVDLADARIILARNPAYYVCKRLAHDDGSAAWLHFHPSPIQRYLPLRNSPISFLESWRLERKMRNLGMPTHFMPSTGMIAYDWICRRMRKGDTLVVEGFTFEGWDRHPWEIERQLVAAR